MKKTVFAALLAVMTLGLFSCGKSPATLDFAGKKLTPVEFQGKAYDLSQTENPVQLLFTADENRLAGNTGCNLLMGDWYSNEDTLNVNIAGVTMMMCTPESGEFERAFVDAMKIVNRYEYNSERNEVVMFADDAVIGVFAVAEIEQGCCAGKGGEHKCCGHHADGDSAHVCCHKGDSSHVCCHKGDSAHVCGKAEGGEKGHACCSQHSK